MLTARTPFRTEQVSPSRLALGLAFGLLTVVVFLSWLAPAAAVVDLEQLSRLVEAGRVVRLEVGEGGLTARLTEPVAVADHGVARRVERVVTAAPLDEAGRRRVEGWRVAGLEVVADDGSGLPESGPWLAMVIFLLIFGLIYLVVQARRYRRYGSPRQFLEQARADLEAGRISPAQFEERAAAITIEM